jgi:hypothetical protein
MIGYQLKIKYLGDYCVVFVSTIRSNDNDLCRITNSRECFYHVYVILWLLVLLTNKRSLWAELVRKDMKSSVYIGSISGVVFFLFIFGGLYWLYHYFIDIKSLQVLLAEWGFSGNGIIVLLLVLVTCHYN